MFDPSCPSSWLEASEVVFVDHRCVHLAVLRPAAGGFAPPPRPPTSRYTEWHAAHASARSPVQSETASWFFVCDRRYPRLATETICSVNLIQSGSVTGAARPFSHRNPGVSIHGEAS